MINYQKLIETAEHHIRRGDGMVMDPVVIREMALRIVELKGKLEWEMADE